MTLPIFARASELDAHLAAWRRGGQRIALVPTMGNLHAGHYSLVTIARKHADVIVASVFVNPTQFGPNEDFARYPRTPDADAAGLAASGCDALFMPGVEEMYPYGPANTVRVSVPGFDMLEGAMRPGHFDGVATVVSKLFNLVRPDVAVFGRKDYQQLLVIKRLARDLAYPIEIVDAPTLREASGLAMSSRNQYLDEAQRARAGVIYATLQRMRESVRAGQPIGEIEAKADGDLRAAGFVPDYAAIRRADDLREPVQDGREALIGLVAARLGTTRLIDNLLLAE
ncbi:MAG TPA: pantoate--beta-alanine ligase [Rhodanobacteraceae bacterium]|nr:pantoate--beta-alanine ligase [Rhodanobacteraceae bacterium]